MKLQRLPSALFAALISVAPVHATEQSSIVMPTAGPMSMSTFIGSYLNPGLSALSSCNWGPAAPANGAGGLPALYECWADTSGTPTSIIFKYNDGARWVAFGTLNASTHVWTPSIAANGLTLGQLPALGANSVIGSIIGGTPVQLTATQLTTLCNTFTASLSGCVPAPGSVAGKFLRDDGTYQTVAGTGTVTSDETAAGAGITVSGSCKVTISGICVVAIDKATASNVVAGAANKVITADNMFTAEVAVPYSTTPTFDLSTFINASIALTGNITSVTLSNIKAGQSGQIRFIQDATGSRKLPATFNTNFKFPGGVQPVLSTAANAVDIIFFSCISTSICYATIQKAFS